MATDWPTTTLGALLAQKGGTVKTGPFGTTLKAHEYSAVGVPLISVGEVGDGSLRVSEKTPRVPVEVTSRLLEYLLEPGDIVFGRKGAVDRSAFVKDSERGWFLGSDGIRLRLPDSVDARFFAYQLQSGITKSWLRQNATGSTMPSLSQGVIERVPVVVPPLPEQRRIAHILGTLDDKIELNRRMNETLEEMARALFKSWFVDFEPVRAKAEGRDPGLPPHLADLFPDRLVDSELGEIPEGWSLGTLGDIAENPRRSVGPGDIPIGTPYIGLEHMPRRSIALGDWGLSDDLASGKSLFRQGEVLFGRLRPYFHKVGVAPLDGVCSTDILVLRGRDRRWTPLVALVVSSDEFIAYTDAHSSGTKMPRTSWRDMAAYPVIRSPDAVIEAFAGLADAVARRINRSTHESRALKHTRDALLPRLVSGQLGSRAADHEEAAPTS